MKQYRAKNPAIYTHMHKSSFSAIDWPGLAWQRSMRRRVCVCAGFVCRSSLRWRRASFNAVARFLFTLPRWTDAFCCTYSSCVCNTHFEGRKCIGRAFVRRKRCFLKRESFLFGYLESVKYVRSIIYAWGISQLAERRAFDCFERTQ